MLPYFTNKIWGCEFHCLVSVLLAEPPLQSGLTISSPTWHLAIKAEQVICET